MVKHKIVVRNQSGTWKADIEGNWLSRTFTDKAEKAVRLAMTKVGLSTLYGAQATFIVSTKKPHRYTKRVKLVKIGNDGFAYYRYNKDLTFDLCENGLKAAFGTTPGQSYVQVKRPS